ncbi:hypothetical protein SD425_27190 (plasmid) [Hymenobacter sp. GOD-10R]|nr:hypothetical protein [Hymenobacter sp. GOD-10R]WRQ31376.1 hypothetical protein SD425_27190 [Hymenobacter sp. GOD-10R]
MQRPAANHRGRFALRLRGRRAGRLVLAAVPVPLLRWGPGAPAPGKPGGVFAARRVGHQPPARPAGRGCPDAGARVRVAAAPGLTLPLFSC